MKCLLISTLLIALGAPGADALQTPPKTEESLLFDAGSSGGGDLGSAVAVSGDLAVAGAPGSDGLAGAATVFQRQGSAWVALQELVGSDTTGGDIFGRSVALSGEVLAAGAPFDDDAGSSSGSVYVFERPASDFAEVAKLVASDAAALAQFGFSLALDGDLLVVGATGDTANGAFAGAAYVFERLAGVWTEVAKLTASDGAPSQSFGVSVAISGTRILVGAQGTPSAAGNPGAAYVFERQGGAFVEVARLADGAVANADLFGFSVALSGSVALVGAPRRDGVAFDTGAVAVFEEQAGVWSHVETLLDDDPQAGARFGSSVALDGALAAAGAPEADDEGISGAGRAALFERGVAGFAPLAVLVMDAPGGGGDALGRALAVDGPILMAGAPDADPVAGNDGLVAVFDRRLLPFGEGCAPDGVEPPRHRVVGHPESGAELAITTEGGEPGAAGVMFVGLGPASLELVGCTLLVDPVTLVSVPLVLSASGDHELTAVVPPALSGSSAASQVFLVDPGAPGGARSTAGVLASFD